MIRSFCEVDDRMDLCCEPTVMYGLLSKFGLQDTPLSKIKNKKFAAAESNASNLRATSNCILY
jgi:hypothetical protein